jgi:hypothetical protein
MKKILLFISFMLSNTLVFGQYTLFNEEAGVAVNDGDVITVNQNHFTTNIILTNTGSVPLKATLEVLGIDNTDGAEMEFCFGIHAGGTCYFRMNQNAVYDSNANNNNYLQPGEATALESIDFTHHDNNSNFTIYPKVYHLKMTLLQPGGDPDTADVVIGTTNFDYLYDPEAQSINGYGMDDFRIATETNFIQVDSQTEGTINLYNLTGQKVKQFELKSGMNQFYTGDLPKGIYIFNILSKSKPYYKKIILK